MKRFLLHIDLLISMLSIMIVLSSCVNDSSECPAATSKESFRIQFQIATKAEGTTRAADLYGQQEGSGAENFLNVNDIKYYLFDKDLNFITDISPDATTTAANDLFTLYNVVAEVDDDYFLENINTTLDFYILVLANHSQWVSTLPEFYQGENITSFFYNGVVMDKGIKDTANLLEDVNNPTSVHFPMAGLQRFTFHGSMLLTTDSKLPYDISLSTGNRINLLRALAKIEIIDKINIAEGAEFDEEYDNNGFRIKEAYFNGFMASGTLLPAYNQWSRGVVTPETQQVEVPTIPEGAIYNLPPVLYGDNMIGSSEGLTNYSLSFEKDQIATSSREDKCPVYSCYVYEYSKLNIDLARQSYFTVTITGSTDPEIESMTFPVRMATYENGVATSDSNLENLLRNHIYRFEISAIQQELTVNWTVCPMGEATTEINYN